MTTDAGSIPTFVVAGAARSGTTAVVEALRAHPDVFVTRPKEPHYFAFAGGPVEFTGPGDDATINRIAVTARERYLALYPADPAGDGYRALGDGSVSTLYYHRTAIPEILALNPAMRVVIILRDPVERAYSSFQYMRARGLEPLADFAAALREEPRRIAAGWQHLWHYDAMSRYADAVEHFLGALGRDQVGVWFYEDLAGDGPVVIDQICRFLGVAPERAALRAVPRVNVSGEPRSRRLQTLIQGATRHRGVRLAAKRIVPFGVRERVRRANLRPAGAPAGARQELRPVFRDDVVRLAELLDRPIPDWIRD